MNSKMKIPKSLKLPRKLKKELKKGFTRNIRNSGLQGAANPISFPVNQFSMYQTVSYSGSNNKSFRRLCKFARKEEKRLFTKLMNDAIAHMNFDFDNDVEDMLMGRMVFRYPQDCIKFDEIIELQRNANRKAVNDDIITASCIGLYCED